jgi:hypothetical protein
VSLVPLLKHRRQYKMANVHIVLGGRTGEGKSALGVAMLQTLGFGGFPFPESDSAVSCTSAPKTVVAADVAVTDTPGLMDSRGVVKDEANLRAIVDHVKASKKFRGLFIVVNEQAPRFDDSMQDAVKILVESFGPDVLGNMGFVFTHSLGKISSAAALATSAEFTRLLGAKIGIRPPAIPCWQVRTLSTFPVGTAVSVILPILCTASAQYY